MKEVSRYVHLNPVRIKTYSGMEINQRIKILSGYIHSSFAGYTDTRKREDFVHYQRVLDCFGGDTKEGRAAYRQFVYRGLNKGETSPLEIGKGNGIIGSERFIEKIKDKYLSGTHPSNHREQPQLKEIRTLYKPEDVINAFCRLTGVDREEICRKGRNAIERSMLMESLYRLCNINQPEIGRYLGNVDYSAVSISRKRLRLKIEKDESLKQRFEEVLRDLSNIRFDVRLRGAAETVWLRRGIRHPKMTRFFIGR